jgi:hypothetical protein
MQPLYLARIEDLWRGDGIVTVTGEGKELARLNTDFMRPQPQLATGRLLRP